MALKENRKLREFCNRKRVFRKALTLREKEKLLRCDTIAQFPNDALLGVPDDLCFTFLNGRADGENLPHRPSEGWGKARLLHVSIW